MSGSVAGHLLRDADHAFAVLVVDRDASFVEIFDHVVPVVLVTVRRALRRHVVTAVREVNGALPVPCREPHANLVQALIADVVPVQVQLGKGAVGRQHLAQRRGAGRARRIVAQIQIFQNADKLAILWRHETVRDVLHALSMNVIVRERQLLDCSVCFHALCNLLCLPIAQPIERQAQPSCAFGLPDCFSQKLAIIESQPACQILCFAPALRFVELLKQLFIVRNPNERLSGTHLPQIPSEQFLPR
mmetsp:Transcript_48944/g.98058  ORF Transcript_48944/g.98058 Transcript_48944/m.98058 type:complete len:246 (-) Transcript_48944:92-829(-)